MRDPNAPEDPTPGAGLGSSGGGQGEDFRDAREMVGQVIAWCNDQLLAERRSATPDVARIERLKSERDSALSDQQALEEAGAEETARIAAFYAARLKEL